MHSPSGLDSANGSSPGDLLPRWGLNPKVYARAVRFNAMLKARKSQPQTTWTELAHAAGYADQAHFVRECRELTNSLSVGVLR